MIADITAVTCPKCGRNGGHEMHEVAADGSYRALLCGSCHLSWKVFG